MWRAKLVAIGLWAGAIAALIASIAFIVAVTTAHATQVASVTEPSPRNAFEQRWAQAVHLCAYKVEQRTGERFHYVIAGPGNVLRTTSDRQEQLYQVCLKVLGVR